MDPQPPPEPPVSQPESHTSPPSNPNTNTSSSSSAHDHEKTQRHRGAMENFRAKLMEYAQNTPMSSAQKLLIEQRVSDIFQDRHIPNHPPYAEMIQKAIRELNEEGGSSEEAISIHIRKEQKDLPYAHASFLTHYLGKLCESGDVIVTGDKCYMLTHGSLTFNPSHRPSPTRRSPSPILIFSRSPSPSSSSHSSYIPSPKRRQKKRTGKRKYGKRRGRPRKRPRTHKYGERRGRSRKKLESEDEIEDSEKEFEERPRPCKFGKRRGRPRKKLESEDEFEDSEEESEESEVEFEDTDEEEEFEDTEEEEFQESEQFQTVEEEMKVIEEENQVIEDQKTTRQTQKKGRGRPPKKSDTAYKSLYEEGHLEVAGVENQVIQDQKRGQNMGKRRGRPRKKVEVETEVKETQKAMLEAQNQATEDPKSSQQGKRRGRPRKHYAIKEESKPKEQIGVIEVQSQVIENQIEMIENQKQPEEEKEDLFEEQKLVEGVKLEVNKEQSQLPIQQDEVFVKQNQTEKENTLIISEPLIQGVVFEDQNEQEKQETGVNEEQNQPEEQQNDVTEGKNQLLEQNFEEISEQGMSHYKQNRVTGKLDLQQGQLEEEDETLTGIQKQLKGACVDPNLSDQSVTKEMIPSPEKKIEVITDHIQPCQQKCEEIVQHELRQEQEMKKKLLVKGKEQIIKSLFGEREIPDSHNLTRYPESSSKLKKFEKLSLTPDELPQKETENESNPCHPPSLQIDKDITMEEMRSSQVLHKEEQPECTGQDRLPKLNLTTTTESSSPPTDAVINQVLRSGKAMISGFWCSWKKLFE